MLYEIGLRGAPNTNAVILILLGFEQEKKLSMELRNTRYLIDLETERMLIELYKKLTGDKTVEST